MRSKTTYRAQRALVLLALALLPARTTASAPLPLDISHWFSNPLQWRLQADGFQTAGGPNSLAIYQKAPVCGRVTVEAEVRVREVAGESWKVAGVAVYLDSRNFWHFALVEEPNSAKRDHFVELCEMRDGEWLSQRNLKTVVNETAPETWKTGQTYRLRISLDPKGVEGSLTDAAGRTLFRKRYAFTAPAVTAGRPALRCGGFKASFSKLSAEYSEPASVAKPSFPAYRCDSYVSDLRSKATGVFRVERRGETWWAIDPLGRGFVPLGVDHVTYRGSWCEKLGYAPYGRKNDKKYRSRDEWAKETIGRLRSWGFNVLTASSSPMLFRQGLAHTRFVAVGSIMARMGDEFDITPNEGRPCSAFPNVFHPDFERYCQYRAHQVCRPYVADPWLFGYFLDNELAWWGRGAVDTGLFDATMKKDAAHTAKRALRDFLATRYGNDVARFNTAWGARLKGFDDVLALDALSGTNAQTAAADKKAFLALIADRYFGVLTRAIRSVDPDHMILGCRFAGGRAADVVWAAAARNCEVLTFNYYGSVDLNRDVALGGSRGRMGERLPDVFEGFYRLGGRPMMVTEWSFPALDSGLPCTKGAGQRFRTQAERARASDIYARATLRMPFMIGFDYFMWVDEPALGISETFPENTNYGLVTEDGKPYAPLVSALSRVNRDAAKLRREGLAGHTAEAAREPKPPSGPNGTQLVLWNRTTRDLSGGLAWVPVLRDETAKRGTALAMFDGRGWTAVPTQIITRPHGPHAAVVRLPAIRARAAVFLRSSESGIEGQPHRKLSYARKGDRYSVETGAFSVSGTLGRSGLTNRVSHRGVALGRYNAMLQEWVGRNQWIDANRLVDVRAVAGPMCLTLDLVGRFENDGPQDVRRPFEVAHRLTFFPDADWFVAELLWLRNRDRRPLEMQAFFFRLYTEIGGASEGDRALTQRGVPRLWGAVRGDAWLDDAAGAFWGLTAEDGNPMRIRFWLDDKGGQHPDARLELKRTLAPGETFHPSSPVYCLGVAGRGGRVEWEARAQRVTDLIALSRN